MINRIFFSFPVVVLVGVSLELLVAIWVSLRESLPEGKTNKEKNRAVNWKDRLSLNDSF